MPVMDGLELSKKSKGFIYLSYTYFNTTAKVSDDARLEASVSGWMNICRNHLMKNYCWFVYIIFLKHGKLLNCSLMLNESGNSTYQMKVTRWQIPE